MRAVVLASAALLTLTGCGGGGTTAAPTPAPATTPAAAPTYDQSTLLACKEAKAAISGGSEADKHASSARAFAALSDVPALRDVAARNTRADETGQAIDDVRALTAATTVDTWCILHKIPGS